MERVNRRDFLAMTAGGLAATVLLPSQVVSAAEKRRPNIIFLITDDQPRSDFNFLAEGQYANGKPKNLTPNIDRLASEGLIFDQQHVSSPVCTPSRYSCLTGTYASRAKNRRFKTSMRRNRQANVTWNTHIVPETHNLARTLQDAGYATGAVGKNHVVEAKLKAIPKGVSALNPEIVAMLKENQEASIEAYKACGFDYAASIYPGNIPRDTCKELESHNMDWIVKGALDFIDQVGEQPFFLYMATTLNHGPGGVGKKWSGNPLATPAGLLKSPLNVMPARDTIPQRLEEAGVEFNRATDNLWLDDGIGAVMGKLESLGLDEDTIIIYFNDHGMEEGKGSLYEGGTLSPSIVWSKSRFKGGKTIDQLISNIDFAPTILDLCGVEAETGYSLDGRSFRSLIEGGNEPIHKSLYFEIGATRAILKDGWKYLAFRVPEHLQNMSPEERTETFKRADDPQAPFSHMIDIPGGRGTEQRPIKHYRHYHDKDQLYDLKKDPGEQSNLAKDLRFEEKLAEMKADLTEYLKQVPGSFGEFIEGS